MTPDDRAKAAMLQAFDEHMDGSAEGTYLHLLECAERWSTAPQWEHWTCGEDTCFEEYVIAYLQCSHGHGVWFTTFALETLEEMDTVEDDDE